MLTIDDKKSILKNSSIFSAVPDDILAQMTDALETVSVQAGEGILEKGDSGTSIYILVEGQVRVHDGELFFNNLYKGDVFGEMAALDPDVRSATITAEVNSVLFRLDQHSLYDLMTEQIEVVREIIHVLCQHLRNRVYDLAQDFQQRQALEQEMEIGRKIQASFLPDVLPQVPGWDIAAYFQAAREVAGDFYDAFTLPHQKNIGLVIGDVCDKGVGAALFMTLFRSLLRATSNSNNFMGWPDSSVVVPNSLDEQLQVMTNLKDSVILTNNYIARTHGQTNMFATLFFAILNPTTGSLMYINGGHEAPIIFNGNNVKAHLETTGPAVGIFPGTDFKVQEARLEPGDTLIAFTDGVTEAPNQNREFFTKERLVSLLQESNLSAADLLHHIEANLSAHAAGTDQFDDITMLAVKRISLPGI